MKIHHFKIENFKNIGLAEASELPNFLVICGSNGCGKSSILEALMTAKEAIAGYGYFSTNPNCVSANADKARIELTILFNDKDVELINAQSQNRELESPEFRFVVEIQKNGNTSIIEISSNARVQNLLSRYNEGSIFFDYFSAHRGNSKNSLSNWSPSHLNEDTIKQILSRGTDKFQMVKQHLANLKMGDLQQIQKSRKVGKDYDVDSLDKIRSFFNSFFSPMEFDDVYIDSSPFKFNVKTPKGEIDIDELSSGEKEILNTFIHFDQLKPDGSIVLFDEPDVHLHPELQRNYLTLLRNLSSNNQFIITTHSPEMMIDAGNNALFTVVKHQLTDGANQFIRVSTDAEMHNALSEVMGSKGFVSLNKNIVFIEGQHSSTDVQFYQKLFPREKYNISFIPAGDSKTLTSISERVNYLLKTANEFQNYYCITDRDIPRDTSTDELENLFTLPVYHVENFLLDENLIHDTLSALLGAKYQSSAKEIDELIKKTILEENHVVVYTKAILDNEVFTMTQTAKDLIFQNKHEELANLTPIMFIELKPKAIEILSKSIEEGTYKSIGKGRDILKAIASQFGVNYDHLRNLLISKTENPPEELKKIIEEITAT